MADALGMRIEVDGGVRIVHLERAERRNAIDEDTAIALTEFFLAANLDPEVRALVLTGTGRDYCTGADVVSNPAAPALSPLDYRFGTDAFRALFKSLWELERPVVSAVNGTVAGAGWTYALIADLVVANRDARWTHVFSRRGMVPHAGDPYFLPRIIPFHRLNEIALLSDSLSSADLSSWGLLNRVVDAEEVLSTALELAQRLAAGPTRTLGLTKRLYRNSLSVDMATSFEAEQAATALISTTEDRREGELSFVEGRPPKFTGR